MGYSEEAVWFFDMRFC